MIAPLLAKLSARERAIVVVALLVVLAAAADWFVFRPVWLSFVQQNRDIRQVESRMRLGQQALDPARRAAVEAEYRKYSAFIHKQTTPSEERAAMLSEIEGLANRSQVTLTGNTPREPRPKDVYEEYVVEVEVEAALPNFVSFLYALQGSPQVLRVRKMDVAPKSREQPSVVKGTLAITKIVAL